jgi:hypothetical protein
MSTLEQTMEGSSFQLQLGFFDEFRNAVTPSNARYRIDCETSRTMIQDWTSFTPSSPIIDITSTNNAIVDQSNLFELRLVTVQANHGTDAQFTDRYRYLVKNLYSVT